MEYDLYIGEIEGKETQFIVSNVENADAVVKENYIMNIRTWVNDSGSDESIYHLKKSEKAKVEFWAYTALSEITYMNFLVFDGKAEKIENEELGVVWKSGKDSMLHKTVEIELPSESGVYELYVLSLPISTNSFLDTFTSEKIILIVE